MADLIDRQEAIRIASGYCHSANIAKELAKLPSAQPDAPDTNADTISRQDAIRWVKTECNPYGKPTIDFESGKRVIEHLKQMPSAQPEPIRINLNEPIKVKLTDWGKEIYYHQYDRINQIAGREICKPKFPKEDENGYTEFQLWCFIELYGIHIGMTLPNVIEPLEIVYER